MHDLAQTVRIRLRSLAQRPGFALLAAGTIALGVAATATIFGVLRAVVLEPLPYLRPSELVTLDVISPEGYSISTSIPNYRDWRDGSRGFSAWGAAAGWDLTITGQGAPEVLPARLVLGDFFGTLGVPAVLGRTIDADATEPGAPAVAVLGNRFWRRKFAGDPGVVGRVVDLDLHPFTIVGVLPPGVGYPSPETDIYVPMGVNPNLPWDNRDSSFGTRIIARLAPGWTPAAAQRDLERVQREIVEREGPRVARPMVRPLDDLLVGDLRPRLWLLAGAVAFVLSIAAANVASLLLVRAEARRHELCLRAALGAGRRSIAGEVVVESVLLALAGGGAGLLLAPWLLQSLRPLLPPDELARFGDRIVVDLPVVLFALGLALVLGLVVALVPLVRAPRNRLAEELAREGRTTAGGRMLPTLLVAEVALALVLLIGSGLMLRSLAALHSADKGFDARSVLAARVTVPRERLPDKAAWRDFYRRLDAAAATIPGVRSAALALSSPLSQRSWEELARPPEIPADKGDSCLFQIVSNRYFQTLGVPILRGRSFGRGDRDGSRPVTVIDERMAAAFWPGRDPLGRLVNLNETDADGQPLWRTVVGIAKNVRHYELTTPSRMEAYVPFEQSLDHWGMDFDLLLSTSVPPRSVLPALGRKVARLDPDVPLFDVATLEDRMDRSIAGRHTLGVLLTLFGALALILAAIGIFAVISFQVAQRMREIGIRMALGADAGAIGRWVVARIARLAGLGLALGLLAALGLTPLLRSFLFRVTPLDPALYGLLATLLFAVALAAGWLPSRRATRVDPVEVLRRDA